MRGSNRNGNTLKTELRFIQGDELKLVKNAFQNKYKAKIRHSQFKVRRPKGCTASGIKHEVRLLHNLSSQCYPRAFPFQNRHIGVLSCNILVHLLWQLSTTMKER